jgi:hypothetical protein
MSKKNPNEINIDTSAFDMMQDIKKKQESGEKLDPYTKEAVESIEMASNLMDSIMSGRHIDLVMYKLYTKHAIAKLRKIDKRYGVKRRIKSRIEEEK